jgi:hypothetical protein
MATMRPFVQTLSLVVLAVALVACGAPSTDGGASGQSVAVAVQPGSVRVEPGGSAEFAATVTGTADTTVLWDVVESGGGTVNPSGLYTAPGSSGVFHVRATSRASPAVSGQAAVSVVAPVSVAISPKTPSVVAGGTVTFTAVVANASNTAVTWSVPTAGCGTITPAGVYTAPTVARTCTVAATSQADPSKSDTATVTVTAPPPPVAVTITPSSGTVDSCRSTTFSAAVTGTSNTAVTWSVQEGVAGGTITPAGVYTAPENAGTYHVVATSAADGSKSAVAPVAVTDRVLSVAVSPQTIQVPPGGTAQFTATVTTTCGTAVALRTVNSRGQIVER